MLSDTNSEQCRAQKHWLLWWVHVCMLLNAMLTKVGIVKEQEIWKTNSGGTEESRVGVAAA